MTTFPTISDLYSMPKKFPSDKEIGIEIEMEGRHLNIKRNRTWNQKGDGSLRGDETIEYVLQAPTPLKFIKRDLTKLLGMLFDTKDKRKAVLRPSDRCGVHIHINVQNLTFFEVFNFMFLYLMFEEVLVGYCGKSREGNLFCLRAKDAEYFIDCMIDCKKSSDLTDLHKSRDTLRYSSMNPGAIFKFGSVEFRSLKTPNDLLDIEEWARILYQIKEASLRFDEPVHIIEAYSREGEDRFFDSILGRWADLIRRKVKDVDQKLLNGVRITQDIAYTEMITTPMTLNDLKGTPKKKKSMVFDRHGMRIFDAVPMPGAVYANVDMKRQNIPDEPPNEAAPGEEGGEAIRPAPRRSRVVRPQDHGMHIPDGMVLIRHGDGRLQMVNEGEGVGDEREENNVEREVARGNE